MTNPLIYVPTPMPEGGVFKISPSAFPKFVDRPHIWYRDEVLDENPFSHNTSSVIGTIVHYCAECVARNQDVNQDYIDEYINLLEIHDEYDPNVVREQYTNMAERLVNDYVLECSDILEVETQHVVEIKDGFYAGGTIDLLQGSKEECMLVDYKSYSSKTKPRAIPSHYKYQLLVYCYILAVLGYNVSRIRLVYINRHIEGEISEKTGKQMKSYPPEVTVLTETIIEEDLAFIEGLLLLAVDSVKASEAHPELRHVIWHDPRLAE